MQQDKEHTQRRLRAMRRDISDISVALLDLARELAGVYRVRAPCKGSLDLCLPPHTPFICRSVCAIGATVVNAFQPADGAPHASIKDVAEGLASAAAQACCKDAYCCRDRPA